MEGQPHEPQPAPGGGVPQPLGYAVLTAVIALLLAALLLTLFALPSHASGRRGSDDVGAATWTVISASEIRATVPSGATTQGSPLGDS
jgi:hypothetical protein